MRLDQHLRTWLLAGAFVLTPPAAAAQSPCAKVMAVDPQSEPDTSAVMHHAIADLEDRLDVATSREAFRRDTLRQAPRGLRGDVSHVLPDLRAWILSDSAARINAAQALARMMEGEARGYSAAQASLASELYEAWSLPSEAATFIVLHPQSSSRARTQAVLALKRFWADTSYALTAFAPLCGLGARLTGIALVRGADSTATVQRLLNDDEEQLLDVVELSLSENRANRARVLRQLSASLPSTHVLLVYLRKAGW